MTVMSTSSSEYYFCPHFEYISAEQQQVFA